MCLFERVCVFTCMFVLMRCVWCMFGMGCIVVCGQCVCLDAFLGVYGIQKVFVCVWMYAACDTCMIFMVYVHVYLCLCMWYIWHVFMCVWVCGMHGAWLEFGVCVHMNACGVYGMCGMCSHVVCVHVGECGVAMVFMWCEWIYLRVCCIVMCAYICFCACLYL